jgi:hypothetical protein
MSSIEEGKLIIDLLESGQGICLLPGFNFS